jgi:HSP20 family protein
MSLLTKYEPQALSNWIDDFFGSEGWFEPRAITGTYPAVEVREEKDHFELTAEVPGLTREDISVTVENGVLTLSGEKKHEKEEEKKGYRYSERNYGRFERSFSLGDNVSPENVEAEYKNGVLRVRLKKNPKAEPKQIQVK